MTQKYSKENRRRYDRTKERDNRSFIHSFKNKPCADCGVCYHPAVMEFDHLRDKHFALSSVTRHSKERILNELSKCELVCANCHRMRTVKRRHSKEQQHITQTAQLLFEYDK